jgi:hypothetical protein
MPKQLINVVGIVICVGILALAITLVAIPIFFQSLATNAQTAQVDQTNDVYQAQLEGLRADRERMAEIEASVTELRTQIPLDNELDEVFEIVARAASDANVQVQTVTAGENTAFETRTAPLGIGAVAEPSPAEPQDDTIDAEDPDSTQPGEGSTTGPMAEAAPSGGRQQVDFTIVVSAARLEDAVRFLEQLRSGPRLLSAVDSIVAPTGSGFDVSISALTYVRSEN